MGDYLILFEDNDGGEGSVMFTAGSAAEAAEMFHNDPIYEDCTLVSCVLMVAE